MLMTEPIIGGNESQRVVLKALSDQDSGYRRWMRPSYIIQQNRDDRRFKRPGRIVGLIQRLLRWGRAL